MLDLPLTQLLGGSMAAATAAALGSRLGVVGTITGAAVLSVISAIAANVYTNSMARAREAVVVVRSRRLADGSVQVATERVAAPMADARRPRWWQRPDRPTTRRLLLTAGAVFAVAAAFVTGLQLTTGAQVTGTDIGPRTTVRSVPSPGGSPAGAVPGQNGAPGSSSTAATTAPNSGTTSVSGGPTQLATTSSGPQVTSTVPPAPSGQPSASASGAPTTTAAPRAAAPAAVAPAAAADPVTPATTAP